MIVVDTNILVHLFLPSPMTPLARKAAALDSWCAPLLWRSEFRNVLATYIRNLALDANDARQIMTLAERLLWGKEYTVRSSVVFDCITTSKRSAYDCEFVALARELGLKLVTTDEPIIHDFPMVAVPLAEFCLGNL